MRRLLRSFIAIPLAWAFAPQFIPPAFGYAPPCNRGDIYVGASLYAEADCIERRTLKVERALELQGKNIERRVFTGESRRTQSERIRNVYLHPSNARLGESGFLRERLLEERKHPVVTETREAYYGPIRAGEEEVSRRDWSPDAQLSFRSRRAWMKKERTENPRHVAP